MSSHFGKNLKVSVFGQSHSAAIGAVVDGLPAGYFIDTTALQAFADRRRAKDALSTARRAEDRIEIVSGLFEGKTCGAPLALFIKNGDVRSSDYAEIDKCPRPSHADYTSYAKYGWRDYRGGGHFSGRLTAALCAAGGVAMRADGTWTRGIIVRHLVLPLCTNDSLALIRWFTALRSPAYFSLMGQYTPCGEAERFPELRRRITPREYKKVLSFLQESGIEHIFAQELGSADERFIPDFSPDTKNLF